MSNVGNNLASLQVNKLLGTEGQEKDMDAKDFARQALGEKGAVSQVYWVACGGSVIDLYPAHCLINATSKIGRASCRERV